MTLPDLCTGNTQRPAKLRCFEHDRWAFLPRLPSAWNNRSQQDTRAGDDNSRGNDLPRRRRRASSDVNTRNPCDRRAGRCIPRRTGAIAVAGGTKDITQRTSGQSRAGPGEADARGSLGDPLVAAAALHGWGAACRRGTRSARPSAGSSSPSSSLSIPRPHPSSVSSPPVLQTAQAARGTAFRPAFGAQRQAGPTSVGAH